MSKLFSRSMYANAEDLYKAKAEYYEQKYESCRADYEQKVIEAVMDTVGQDVIPDYRIKRAIEAIKQVMADGE